MTHKPRKRRKEKEHVVLVKNFDEKATPEMVRRVIREELERAQRSKLFRESMR